MGGATTSTSQSASRADQSASSQMSAGGINSGLPIPMGGGLNGFPAGIGSGVPTPIGGSLNGFSGAGGFIPGGQGLMGGATTSTSQSASKSDRSSSSQMSAGMF
ncbi:hypothetical protein PSTG_04398 [Puccinia striiformis f. sp. tritici PST-78]|nr:hypothetical protein PSTG_04398 [Puccinia striiformis f. sp. tritici PST-78]